MIFLKYLLKLISIDLCERDKYLNIESSRIFCQIRDNAVNHYPIIIINQPNHHDQHCESLLP